MYDVFFPDFIDDVFGSNGHDLSLYLRTCLCKDFSCCLGLFFEF